MSRSTTRAVSTSLAAEPVERGEDRPLKQPVPQATSVILEDVATLTVSRSGTLTIPPDLLDAFGLRPRHRVSIDNLFGQHLVLTPLDEEADQ